MSTTSDAMTQGGAVRATAREPRPRDARKRARSLHAGVACLVAWLLWNAAAGTYTPGSAFGYALGVIGATMMAVLLLYPLRKRVRALRSAGALKHWFAMHMACGVAGPLCVLLHSTMRLRSMNATVAVACMILVAVSGLVGRFIYRRIHHGLYGARASLEEVEAALGSEMAQLDGGLRWVPDVKARVDAFAAYAAHRPGAWPARVGKFFALGPVRACAAWRIRAAVSRAARGEPPAVRRRLEALAHTSADAMRGMQRVAQFRAYERLFSLWHVLHVPFVAMLVISAVVHVVAVHMY